MHVGIAYADKFKQTWLKLDVPDDSTVRDAIERSGLLNQFPDIDLASNKVGIFGKIVSLEGNEAKIEIADKVVIRILKSQIAGAEANAAEAVANTTAR